MRLFPQSLAAVILTAGCCLSISGECPGPITSAASFYLRT